jgi:hypothetical protein
MPAFGGGGNALGARRAKDQAMARRMKEEGIERTTMRCPTCYGITQIVSFPGHVQTICKGGKQES